MVESALAVFLYLSLIIFVGCIWGLIVNHRTCDERIALIKWVCRHPDRETHLREYERVGYMGHFWALFFFRDPKRLYHFQEKTSRNPQ